MSTESYSKLLDGMWAPEGSEINAKLQKLQDLERMRKEREMQRKLKQSGSADTTVGTTTRGVRSRLRSNQSDAENVPISDISHVTKQFELELDSNFGGARPKFATTREEPVRHGQAPEDWDQMFQSITGSLLNKPIGTNSEQSSFKRDRYGRSDSEEQSSGYGGRGLRSSYRSHDRPRYTSRYNRTNSQPEEQSDTILGRAEDGPFYSVNTYEPGSYSRRRRYERENEETIGNEGEEQQMENGEHQNEEVIEIQDDDENEEPAYFIERLKKGYDSDDNNNEYNFNLKTGVNGFLSTPIVPPLKKLKPGERDVNDDEQYDDVAQYIHPVEDIVAVAKDINAAFGTKSPKSENATEQDDDNDSNFSFKNSWMAENDRLNENGDFVFTASTPDLPVGKQRTSSSKRKQRSSTKGRSRAYESSPKTSNEEIHSVDGNTDEAIDTTTSFDNYEDFIMPDDSYVEEQRDLAADAQDLYKSRFSTYMDLNQTTGQLDEIQKFFSGKEVTGDPVVEHHLSGDLVKVEMALNIDNVSPRERRKNREEMKKEQEKTKKMSLDERLSKLKTMTDEKSKRQSTRASENRQNGLNNRQSKTPNKDFSLDLKGKTESNKSVSPDKVSKQSPRNQRRSSGSKLSPKNVRKDSEVKKSPRGDLMSNVRELKKFVHKSVSEPATPVLETQLSIDRRIVKEISTQTDTIIFICKHCGKSNSDKDESGKKPGPVSKTTKLDLRVETKNPSQNYTELEQSHLAEIKKEMKGSNMSLAESDTCSNKSGFAPYKPKTATNQPSYMKSTASSSKKTTNGSVDKTARKGSAPDISRMKELELQRKSPVTVGFLKGGKNIVAQRAKAFDGTNTKTSGKDKTKPGLSVYRGVSEERQKKDKTSKGENTASTLMKTKSCEQMSMFSEDKADKRKVDNAKKLVKQKSVDDKLDKAEKSVDNNAVPSSGAKRTRDQMTQKARAPPPPLSPKPVRMVESGPPPLSPKPVRLGESGPPPLSPKPVRMVESGPPPLSPKPVRTIESGPVLSPKPVRMMDSKPALSPKPSRKIGSGLVSPIVVSPLHSKEIKPPSGGHTWSEGGKPEPVEVKSPRGIEMEGHFTTLHDNPFIKRDSKRKNSLRERKEGESVWEREKSRSRESLKRSNTSAGERTSLTHLSWSDSGSTESLPASVSGLKRSVSDRRGSVTSQNSMLNLLDPKGTKTDIVTGMKETNVDEAYEEYVALSRNNSVADESPDDNLNESGLLDFAQQACHLLEFETKKRDSSSDSTETERKVNSEPVGKAKDQVTVNGTSNMKNGVVESPTTADKGGKKTKQKKGFFKGRLFNK